MGTAKVLGTFLILYCAACFFVNQVNYLIQVLPDLGSLGSWVFNPVGMLFSDSIANILSANAGALAWLTGLFGGSITWVVGGIISLGVALFGFLVGLILFGFQPKMPMHR